MITVVDSNSLAEATYTLSASDKFLSMELDKLGFEPKTAPLFPAVVEDEPAALVGCEWKLVHSRHRSWMEQAGFSAEAMKTVSIHSFQGSRAAREHARHSERGNLRKHAVECPDV